MSDVYDVKTGPVDGDLEWYLKTYEGFGDAWSVWMNVLAERAAKKDPEGSLNVVDILDEAIDDPEDYSDIKAQLSLLKERWTDATFIEKVKAVITAIKKRIPPWKAQRSGRSPGRWECLAVRSIAASSRRWRKYVLQFAATHLNSSP